jgi:hypothetical protein
VGKPSADTAPAKPGSVDGAPERTITVQHDRLTVRVTDVALDEVVQAVTEPSKAEIRGALKDSHPVSADFADVPLQDGLTRLLGEQNFVLTYREDGTLKALTLLGGPVEPAAQTKVVKNTATTPPQAPANPLELLQRSIPISGKLQQVVGQPSATLQQLIDLGMRQEDPTVRQEALHTAVSAIDSQPDLRVAVVGSLQSMDDEALGPSSELRRGITCTRSWRRWRRCRVRPRSARAACGCCAASTRRPQTAGATPRPSNRLRVVASEPGSGVACRHAHARVPRLVAGGAARGAWKGRCGSGTRSDRLAGRLPG